MSSLSSDISVFQTPPVRLRVGAGVLVLVLHLAVAALLMLGKRTETLDAAQDSAIMVSVIDAPAPQQAKPQPPAPVAPPSLPVEKVAESDPQPQPEPTPEPVEHLSPLAPVIKPRPKPQPKPQQLVRHVAPTPAPAPAPQQADTASDSQQQQASQAPRQDQPVLVTSVEYDGARPIPAYPKLSRMHGEAGRVVVLVRISPQGGVEDARVDTSSGYARLDDAALDAARRARFKPFTRNGVAMTALAKLPFDFQMRN